MNTLVEELRDLQSEVFNLYDTVEEMKNQLEEIIAKLNSLLQE